MKIVVIGGGPAGEAAARFAAKGQAEVTLIEKENLGGLCLNHGCIPSKTLLSLTKKLHDLKRSEILKDFFQPNALFSAQELWKKIQEQKKNIIAHLRKNIALAIQNSGIKLVFGQAKFLSPAQLQILTHVSPSRKQERIESFDKCVIAVGSEAYVPPPFDRHQDQILDSDKVLELEEIPESLLVVGGGAVGCEFACLFCELGSKVILVEKTARLLPGEDEQVVNHLRNSFEQRGIQIFTSVTVAQLQFLDSVWEVSLSNQTKIRVKKVLCCAGRTPNCGSLDLEKAGVQYARLGIKVNEQLLSSNPDVYAAGDVNGLSLLAHAASAQGEIAAANALGAQEIYDGMRIPRCLYTWPEVASVGMWKTDAESQGIKVATQRFFFKASGRALAEGDSEGFIQILSDKESQKILGAQIIGPHATEMIHVFCVALKTKMTQRDLREVVFAHPTFSEGIRSALVR